MSILIDNNTKLLVQGITGRDGSFHARKMKEYGTDVVSGVTPGKGGQEVDGIPVFNSVSEAKEKTQANTAVIYVPAKFAKEEASIPRGDQARRRCAPCPSIVAGAWRRPELSAANDRAAFFETSAPFGDLSALVRCGFFHCG